MEMDLNKKFEEIYNLEGDSIFRFCLMRVSSRDQALDITQEVFLRLWKTLLSGQEIDNTKAFLFTITRRLIIDWYRKKKSFSLDGMLTKNDSDESFDVIDNKTEAKELMVGVEGRYLLSKLKELKDKNRDILYLRFVEDLSPPEIGKILGVSANTASVRINRALEELRKISGYKIDINENKL